jgi:hypothetical protein
MSYVEQQRNTRCCASRVRELATQGMDFATVNRHDKEHA